MKNAPANFAATPEPGQAKAFALSALAHGVLLALLVWGVRIHSEAPAAMEAELWSALPQLAAPMPVEPIEPIETPPPPPEVVKETKKEDTPEPVKAPDIALEKKLPIKEKAAPSKPAPRVEPKPDNSLQKKQALKEKKENFEREQKRLLEFAGAGGTGIARSNSSPRGDASWIARAAARIKSNTVFNADGISGNPAVELEVQLDPAGYVVNVVKRRSSGVSGFDEAVERAVRKSEPYPPGVSGKVPPSFIFTHKVRE